MNEEREVLRGEIEELWEELDKRWIVMQLAINKIEKYMEFYRGREKPMSEEEMRDLKEPIRTLVDLINPSHSERTGEIGKRMREIEWRMRHLEDLEEENND